MTVWNAFLIKLVSILFDVVNSIRVDFISFHNYLFHRTSNVAQHGTLVAGVAAGQAGNNKCGVGIAYEANIGGALNETYYLLIYFTAKFRICEFCESLFHAK